MSATLTDQDKLTLRTAAYGAVSLLAAAGAAGKSHQIATDGSLALASATGLVGQVLGDKREAIDLNGKSVAELADVVLPALTEAMALLQAHDRAEADNFRRTVVLAIEAAQDHQGEPSPVLTEMAGNITAALDAASMSAAGSASAAGAMAGSDRPELQKIIEDVVDSGFVGMELRVRDERGEWVGRAGLSELGGTAKPPVGGHIRIGSNTKTFTATVVLQLVAEGKLELDTPAADYLPEFDLDQRITVRMLLQHTSGVFNFTGEVFEDGTVKPGIVYSGQEWVEDRFKTYQPEELVRLALSKPARFEPGSDWSYSNTNYVLARLIVEKVTGRSLADEMHRLILGPLELTGTVVPETSPEIPEPHSHAYYQYDDAAGREQTVDVTRQNPSWIATGGDMISTTQDLQTFIAALLGGKLLPANLLAEMITPEAKVGYGLGVFVQNGGTVITHNGGISGHAALMYSTPDGTKTMTAAINYIDDAALSRAVPFQQATLKLVAEVFGAPQTDAADTANPADAESDGEAGLAVTVESDGEADLAVTVESAEQTS